MSTLFTPLNWLAKRFKFYAFFFGLLLAGGGPATLHIGPGAGTACATGGCPIFISGPMSGEVNNLASLDIYQHLGSAKPLNDVLLILGVPNNLAPLSPGTITGVSFFSPYPGTGTPVLTYSFGSTEYGVNGFAGLMTSGDVYSFLGL